MVVHSTNAWADAHIEDDSDFVLEHLLDEANLLSEILHWNSPALELGIGAITDEQNEDFFSKMIAAGVIDGATDWKTTYTTDFSNTGVALDVKKALMSN